MSENAATVPQESTYRFGNGVELPPFRNVNDFLLGKARFELPPYNDLPRWNNRIVSNLLYYQTNYFLIFASLVILQSFFNSQDLALGLSAIVVVAAVVIFAISDNPSFYQVGTS
ncbi:hypothetical protein OESDEN_11084 [Oesophagostomum dentatum]|uniref:PRA1 family protein n=1 Tax=Oesophagostomum dentatum TaxID=61180 RepID=A0A0B1SVX6_OESDE|nr:hypothetical protein OESDEN_11084 [Oesophagostomum dentatum]